MHMIRTGGTVIQGQPLLTLTTPHLFTARFTPNLGVKVSLLASFHIALGYSCRDLHNLVLFLKIADDGPLLLLFQIPNLPESCTASFTPSTWRHSISKNPRQKHRLASMLCRRHPNPRIEMEDILLASSTPFSS